MSCTTNRRDRYKRRKLRNNSAHQHARERWLIRNLRYFKLLRLVYQWVVYGSFECSEYSGGIFPAFGVQFASRRVEPLVHGKRGDSQYTAYFFRCVVIDNKPEARLLTLGQISKLGRRLHRQWRSRIRLNLVVQITIVASFYKQ